MKKIIFIVILLFCVSFLIFYLYQKSKKLILERQEPYTIKVSMILNVVELRRDEQMLQIKTGDLLKEKDILSTDKKSSVELSFENKFKILIKENTTLVIDSLIKTIKQKEENNYQFNLHTGKLYLYIHPLNKNDSWRLKTPTLSLGVRGTQFVIEADNNTSLLKLKDGRLQVSRNIEVPDAYTDKISVSLLANEKLKIDYKENEEVKKMIDLKKLELPMLIKEKVTKDPDFDYLDNYFKIESEIDSGLLIVKNIYNATIYINSVLIGNGDLTKNIKAGTYKITIIHPDSSYVVFEKEIQIQKGETREVIPEFKRKTLEPKEPDKKDKLSN